ncbi:MAG: hypothetical protein PVG84_11570 [Desulfobacterales bacterium]|jgi:hypothetical protein
MKKVGIISLTRQNSLAYSTLKRIVTELGYQPVCGEAIDADSIFLSLEDATLKGYEFLGRFFKQIGFAECDILLVSAPYSANLFILPKIVWCLRTINTAPIIMGGNEMSNNYKNLMMYRYSIFANQVVDIAPDFIVRGAAENALFSLLPLLEKDTMTGSWPKHFLYALLDIPSLVFWMPQKQALISTPFSSTSLLEQNIFAHVRTGKKTLAITLQRACNWARKSKGGCLFCAIASQFGQDFHCAVQSDGFVDEMLELLINNPEIQFVDIWDDTFNISEAWALRMCGYLERINRKVGREIVYSCFLRPKGLTKKLTRKLGTTNVKVAFMGADALTEDLSKRLRRGCTVSEINQSIQLLKEGKVLPRLSVQLFSPESTINDVGITATLSISCIHNGESSVHVHLYTYPLFGSDIFRLLKARGNLKKIPSPLLELDRSEGFKPYLLAYDYRNYDPDLEQIKQRTYRLLGITSSFMVKTYPGDNIDGHTLKGVLKKLRRWCTEAQKTHPLKSLWVMMILCMEDRPEGLGQTELLKLLSKNDGVQDIPIHLQRVYGNFGYEYTLSRSFKDVMNILLSNRWAHQVSNHKYRLTTKGLVHLKSLISAQNKSVFSVAAYDRIDKSCMLDTLETKMADSSFQ